MLKKLELGHESFRVLTIYMSLKGIKCLALGDFFRLNKPM